MIEDTSMIPMFKIHQRKIDPLGGELFGYGYIAG